LTLPRIYSSENLQNTTVCELGADNLRYLKTVLRLKPGDSILVFDGFGHEFEARIGSFSPSDVNVALGHMTARPDQKISITLAQAIPKAAKMDLIIKTAAELGATEIIPFSALRSVSRIEADRAGAKVMRWRKIVQEASRCTRSTGVAVIAPVLSFPEMLLRAAQGALKMIFWEEEDQQTIRDVLTGPGAYGVKEYFIIVGPEGGLSRDEVEQAKNAGFVSVSLGRQILKVETAAAAILSIIQYEKGIFSRRAGEKE
jgi:16S rRNA (uracil1498-N3)-methyltransferase